MGGPSVEQGAAPSSGRGRITRRIELLGSVVVVLLIGGYVVARAVARGLSPRPSVEQCVALLDRYLEQTARVRQPGAHASPGSAVAQQGGTAPARLADVTACRQQLTAAQVRCGLSAPALDALERCLQ